MRIVQPNYTQTPNDLFDHWLPHLGECELKVLLVILRKTFGFHKERDRISLSQMCKLTGCHRTNIIKAAKSLQEKGIILKETLGNPGQQETFYELIVDDSNNSDPSRIETPPSSDTRPPPVSPRDPQKIIPKQTLPKQQQQPAAVSSDLEIENLLKDLNIPEVDKKWIRESNYTKQEKINAILWTIHPKTKINKTLQQAIKWALNAKPDIPKDDINPAEENKAMAQQMHSKAILPKGQFFEVLSKRIEIGHSHSGNVLCIEYTEKGFKEQLMNALRKNNIRLE